MKRWIHAVTEEDPEVEEAWEEYDPFHGAIYCINGISGLTGRGGMKYTNMPKVAIEDWFKMQKAAPMDVAISCRKRSDAVALTQWAVDNEDIVRSFADKYGCPYKIDWIIDECKKKVADGQRYFYENEYGDSIHPFGIG